VVPPPEEPLIEGSLVCPRCGEAHAADERFCRSCRMPLVLSGPTEVEEPVSERHARARKVDPRYTEGQLVRVAGAMNQAEAEFVQGMLLEEGIPSTLRRTRGFDVPDMLAAGPRDVLVPASGHAAARDVLLEAEIVTGEPVAATPPSRVLGVLLGVLAVGALVIWLVIELGR
jgi:hypothetical protein